MIKIGLIAISAIFLAIPLKKEKPEFAILITMAAGIIIFIYSIASVTAVTDFLKEMLDKLPIENSYIIQLLKILGITYVAEFSAAICQDAGFSSVAGQIEVFAKLSILALSIPGIAYIIDVLESFI